MSPLARGRAIAAAAIFLTVVVATATYLMLPPPSLDRSSSASVLVIASDGSILRGFLTGDGKWRLPVEPDMVDPLYRRMLIATEDGRFAWHPGVVEHRLRVDAQPGEDELPHARRDHSHDDEDGCKAQAEDGIQHPIPMTRIPVPTARYASTR